MKKILMCIFALVLSLCCFSGCKSSGEAYTVEEAFEAGLITREDIMEICFQRYGKVYTCDRPNAPEEEWIKVDYPSTRVRPELDKRTEKRILKTYYNKYRSDFFDSDGKKFRSIKDISFYYEGEFNGLYGGVIRNIGDFPQWVLTFNVGGVVWEETPCGFALYKL